MIKSIILFSTLFIGSLSYGADTSSEPFEAFTGGSCVDDMTYVMPPGGCDDYWPDGTPTDAFDNGDDVCCDSPNDRRGYGGITDCEEPGPAGCPAGTYLWDVCEIPGGTAMAGHGPTGGCPAGQVEYWSVFSNMWMCGSLIDAGGGDGDGDGEGGGGSPCP